MKGRKWLIVTLLAAALIIPTGAYAGYTYLADSIYGSKQQAVEKWGETMDYERLEAKLQSARQHLSEEQFKTFMDTASQLGAFVETYGHEKGFVDPEALSEDERAEYEAIIRQMEPLLAILEEAAAVPSDTELLSKDEFWAEQLNIAERTFTLEDLKTFKSLLMQMKAYEAIVAGEDGSYDLDRLTEEQQADLKRVREAFTPYMDRLNLLEDN
ncbi:DUF3600 domain-containing protein [Paenibacillus sp. 1P07SE]|uniref:DUF3600 domain-containing protein n=1 Tax=Paenibacillus sp. 1P07SE TaxID=3132209 RepID=UPI0039A47DFA